MKSPPNKSSYKSSNKLVIITAVFLVLVNIIVLAGVAYNRSGEPIASIKLTERELALPYRSRKSTENSGLALRLKWNSLSTSPYQNEYSRYSLRRYAIPDWLTENKMKELGIDVEKIKANKKSKDYGFKRLNRAEVIFVLEFDGEAFDTVLKIAEKDILNYRNAFENSPNDNDLKKRLDRNEKSLQQLKTTESRLIAIDAGLDLETLKQKYNDSSKYLMLRGEVYPFWRDRKLVADIKQIFNDSVHVALPESEMFSGMERLKRYDVEEKPRYEVELMLGERLEVWVGGVLL